MAQKQRKGRAARPAAPKPLPAKPANTPWIAAALFFSTLIVYWRASSFAFVTYDDNEYVYHNDVVSRGLTFDGIRWAFAGVHSGNWHPLTWISHMLDVSLFGVAPGPQHFISVLIHAASTVILFVALTRMTGAVARSAIVAALFALHPLHVQSVAWISERKDVLSALFGMICLLIYASLARQWTTRKYIWLLVVFALGLLSKQMLVTLPFVLLLLDFWPLRRLQNAAEMRRRVIEKIPLFVLSATASIVVYLAQRGVAVQTLAEVPLGLRVENAILSYGRYLLHTIWPSGLSIFYPYDVAPSAALVAIVAIVLAGITALAWWRRNAQPYLLTGWLWYLGMLIPVIGLIQVGTQSYADRYTYLPLIGVFIAVVWGVADLVSLKQPLVAATAAVLLICAIVTWIQLGYWADGETLFRHALSVTRENSLANNELGMALNEQQRFDDAVPYFREAVRIRPGYVDARVNLGNNLARRGQVAAAIRQWEEAIKLAPKEPDVHNNLGIAYVATGHSEDGEKQFRLALDADSRFVPAMISQARLAASRGDAAAARRELLQAKAIDPDNEQIRSELAKLP
jgi:Flp pilus assembly protein TadD